MCTGSENNRVGSARWGRLTGGAGSQVGRRTGGTGAQVRQVESREFPSWGGSSLPRISLLLAEPGDVHERLRGLGHPGHPQGHQPADPQGEGAHGGAIHA